jgi:hypothetical protein
MDPAWAVVLSALISGPLMWLLYRLEKKNTDQHGKAVDLIKSVKDDVQEVKHMQVWIDKKLDKHIEQDHAS